MLCDETTSYWEFSRSVPVYPRAGIPGVSFAAGAEKKAILQKMAAEPEETEEAEGEDEG